MLDEYLRWRRWRSVMPHILDSEPFFFSFFFEHESEKPRRDSSLLLE